MSGVNDQNKQQVLTRIAATRVRMVDAATTVRNGVQGCVRTLPVSVATLKTIGAVVGGVVASGVIAGKIRQRRKPAREEAPAVSGRVVALQALSALAIPLLQRWLASQQAGAPATGREKPAQATAGFRFALPDWNAAFFRWLGLQK